MLLHVVGFDVLLNPLKLYKIQELRRVHLAQLGNTPIPLSRQMINSGIVIRYVRMGDEVAPGRANPDRQPVGFAGKKG